MEICKRLQVLVPVRLLVGYVLLESLHNRLVGPLSLPVCPRMVDCGEVVFRTQYLAQGDKDLGDELLHVVGEKVLEWRYA